MTIWPELQTDFDERAGFLEFCGGLTKAAAEHQAAAEMLQSLQRHRGPPKGILAELVAAAAALRHPEIGEILGGAGCLGRGPMRGLDVVVAHRGRYRPGLPGERGVAALIVPAGLEAPDDLVAQLLPRGQVYSRLGVAVVLGEAEIELSRCGGWPLLVFSTVTAWLRAGTRGAVPVDWRKLGEALDGVPTLRCSRRMAPALYRATARCWPRPAIEVAILNDTGARHAA